MVNFAFAIEALYLDRAGEPHRMHSSSYGRSCRCRWWSRWSWRRWRKRWRDSVVTDTTMSSNGARMPMTLILLFILFLTRLLRASRHPHLALLCLFALLVDLQVSYLMDFLLKLCTARHVLHRGDSGLVSKKSTGLVKIKIWVKTKKEKMIIPYNLI